MQIIGGGGGLTKLLVILNLPWKGFEKKIFTKVEAYVRIAERMVRDLAIKEAHQDE